MINFIIVEQIGIVIKPPVKQQFDGLVQILINECNSQICEKIFNLFLKGENLV